MESAESVSATTWLYTDIPGVACHFTGADAIIGAEGIVDGVPFYLEVRPDGWTFGVTHARPGDPVLTGSPAPGYFRSEAWPEPLQVPPAITREMAVHLVVRGVRLYRDSRGEKPWETAAYADFRIMRWEVEYDVYYQVHRVYYDAAGTPIAVDLGVADSFGETEEEIRKSCQAVALAATKPALDFHAFPNGAVRLGY